MPQICKASADLLRGYDRFLAVLWRQEIERFVLVRFVPNVMGKFHDLHVFEDEHGAYVEPTPAYIGAWIERNDLAKIRGLNHTDKIRKHLQSMRSANADRRVAARVAARAGAKARLQDYTAAASRFGDDQERIERHVRSNSERVRDEDHLTERERRERLKGVR